MKKAIKLVGGLLVGSIIGFAIAFLLIWIIDGSEGLERAMHKDVNITKVIVSVACCLVSLVITAILQFALHETGHLLFGLASGYKFSSIRVGKYALVKDDKGFHIRKFFIQGTGGQCIMTLPADADTERVPYFWYNAGGVLVNIFLFALSAFILMNFDLGMFGDACVHCTAQRHSTKFQRTMQRRQKHTAHVERQTLAPLLPKNSADGRRTCSGQATKRLTTRMV